MNFESFEKDCKILFREKYNNKTTPSFKKDVARILKGEPLDYVIGWRLFLGSLIDLKYKPLIPRDETEFWVENTIKSIQKKNPKCLDIFSGSGCIGISLLAHIPDSQVTFSDIYTKQINRNLKLNKIDKKRYKVVQSDLFENINDTFDYIFANPPYIPEKSEDVQKSVSDYEPYEALYAGKDGLKIIKKFLKQVKKYLNLNGIIYLEFNSDQKEEIKRICKDWKVKFYKDQFDQWRWCKIYEIK